MKNKTTVEIDAELGSEFQQSFLIDLLLNFIRVWVDQGHSMHSKNKITYTVDTHDGYKVKQY